MHRMREQVAYPDVLIARIAAGQHGTISYSQLLAAGLTRSSVRRRVAAGRLHRLYRGVYAVGHLPVSRRGWWMAATLALPGALLSHFSAAMLWKILPLDGRWPQITVPGQGGRAKRKGIVIHRSVTLTARECRRKERIPVTSVARTIADLRRVADTDTVRRAIRQAGYLKLNLEEVAWAGDRSPLEFDFLGFCRRYGLPMPEVNAKVGIYHVDFLWREQKLAVETDGWAAHRGRQAFEDDHARGLELMRRGIEMLPLTEHQLKSDPAGVAAVLRERLGRAAA